MDPDLEKLFGESESKEKEVTLSGNKKKKWGVFLLPALLLVLIAGLAAMIIIPIVAGEVVSSQLCLMTVMGILCILALLGNLAYFTLNWRMPVKMHLDGAGMRIEYVFSFQDVSFSWKDVKDVKVYDHIGLESGKKVKLSRIAKEDWDEIINSMKNTDTELEATMKLENIIEKTKEAPTREYTIEGMSTGFLATYILVLVLSILLILLAPISIVFSYAKGDLLMMRRTVIFVGISIGAIPLSIKMIQLILKKRKIRVGTQGITVYSGGTLKTNFSWDEIEYCYTTTKIGNNVEAIGIRSKDGTDFWAGHHELRWRRL